MIRPLTIATFLLASGSGLYLYQSKHEVQVLDRTIEKTVHDTNALRDQSRLLAAEWTMLNDPERLRQFSDTYLNLKSINPAQFTSLADLDTRLPAPQTAAPVVEESPLANEAPPQPVPQPVPEAAPVVADAAPITAPAAAPTPVPPAPKAPVVASAVRAPDTKTPALRPAAPDNQPRAVAAAETRPAPPRIAETHSEVRTAAMPPLPRPTVLGSPRQVAANATASVQPPTAQPYPAQPYPAQPYPAQPYRPKSYAAQPYQAQPYQAQPYPGRPPIPQAAASAPAPYTGSLLGMARGSMPPAPRPTPVNATYNTN